ncbi:MAG: crossover junction endodeoxyribonuclease RuvC [Chlamydiales bacterium]
MKKNIVLGLDPGTKITGYGIVQKEASSLILLDYGAIIVPSKLSLADKCYWVFHKIEYLLQRYNPISVAIEGQFVGLNVQATLKIAMAKTSALVACGKVKIPVAEYSPTAIKLAVTGNGRSTKTQVSCMVRTLLQCELPDSPHDITDAIAIAICHLQRACTKVGSGC